MMIMIVRYRDDVGGAYEPFDHTDRTLEDSITECERLKWVTGKCFGVLDDDTETLLYTTSAYYRDLPVKVMIDP